jgi:hypothetical protein
MAELITHEFLTRVVLEARAQPMARKTVTVVVKLFVASGQANHSHIYRRETGTAAVKRVNQFFNLFFRLPDVPCVLCEQKLET